MLGERVRMDIIDFFFFSAIVMITDHITAAFACIVFFFF